MNRVSLAQVQLDAISMDQTVDRIKSMINEERTQSIHVVTPNAQFIQIAESNPYFVRVLQSADLSVADGMSLVWACRLLGHPIPGRVNGTDLMVRLCELAALHSFTVYFLGGRPGAAEGAARQLADRFPGLRIAAIDCPPMGFMDDLDLDLATCDRIEQASPDLLFVALGAPMQEFWIHQHLHLPAKVMIGIGGSFELLSGLTKRAPVFIQNAGCEWLWRLAMEPKRLWRRYLTCNIFFIFLVLRQLFFGRVRAEILSENGEQL